MPAKNPAGGFGGGGGRGARGGSGGVRIYKGYGMARQVGETKWVSRLTKGITKSQKDQNKSATSYKTVDAGRSAAAKKAAATRKANAAAAAREAARSNKAKGRRQGLKIGGPAGLAAGAAIGYGSSYVGRGSEGPKKSAPVKRKKK